jgi:hypothetical protein
MLNNPSKCGKIYVIRQNSSFKLPVPPALLLEDSAGGNAREIWWTNQEFSPVNIIPP